MDHEYAAMQEMIRTYATTAATSAAPLTARERLGRAVERFKQLNLSLRELCRRTEPPTPYGSVNRWLSGEQQPGADRLEETLAEFGRVIAEEEARLRAVLGGAE
jgi:hypothetical protein